MAITLKKLLDHGAGRLALELVSGETLLEREIEEKAINRPGLALTGFFQYFARHRLQVFGLAELTYLKSLSPDERSGRLREMFKQNVPGVIISRNRNPLPEINVLAEEFSTPLLRTSMITSHFINECTLVIEELTAPSGRLQGTMLEVMGIGLLLQGPPGIGKSETALSLISKGYCLVADDVSEIVRTSQGDIVTFANEMTRYHMEIRGIGIVHVPSLYGVASIRHEAKLDMVVKLHPYKDDSDEERTGVEIGNMEVLGVSIPCYSLPVSSGRDTANVIEAAALNFKLKLLGHDAAKELDEKIMGRFLRKAGYNG